MRILNTVLGGGLALAGASSCGPARNPNGCQSTWPGPSRRSATISRSAVQRFDDRSEDAGRALREAERQVGLAILNAEESFQRLLGEHRGPAEALAPAMTLLTYTRRFTASIAALALSRHSVEAVRPKRWRLSPARSTGPGGRGGRARGGPRAGAARRASGAAVGTESPLLRGRLTRLGRQLKTLHDAAARWAEAARR